MKKSILIIGLLIFLFGAIFFIYTNTNIVRSAVSGVINVSARLTGISAPINSNDAATKGYTDSVSGKPSNWSCNIYTNSRTFGSESPASVIANCGTGEKVITGGCSSNDLSYVIPLRSFPQNTTSWACYPDGSGINGTIITYVVCCQ